jgi:hypothetical protein
MAPIVVAAGSLALMACAALVGMALRVALPKHHESAALNETVARALALVVTLTSLVLGFMVGSAKGYYDGVEDKLTRLSADAMLLDRSLARYGPGAGEARELLRQIIGSSVRTLWPGHATEMPALAAGHPVEGLEGLERAIRAFPVRDDEQRALQSAALQSTSDILRTASSLLVTATQTRIQAPIVLILTLWLAIIFLGFGLLAPRNGSAIAALLLSALTASGAVFLIHEMYDPLGGLMQIPPSTLEFSVDRGIAWRAQS